MLHEIPPALAVVLHAGHGRSGGDWSLLAIALLFLLGAAIIARLKKK